MRNIKLAQKQLPVLEQELAQLEKEKKEYQANVNGLSRRSDSRNKTAWFFLTIGIFLGCILVMINKMVAGLIVFVPSLILFFVIRKSANSYQDEYDILKIKIENLNIQIADGEEKIQTFKNIIDNPFNDIDLYTYEMTPQSIVKLEDEAILLFKHKSNNPDFYINKRCWLLANLPLDIMNQDEKEQECHEACMQKLDDSESWILQVTRRFCTAYFASCMLQVVDYAVHTTEGQTVSDKKAASITDYMKDLRAAQTEREDEFIQILYHALEVNNKDDVADIRILPYGLERYLMSPTPEKQTVIQKSVEDKIIQLLQKINSKDIPSYELIMMPYLEYYLEYKCGLTDLHPRIWLENTRTTIKATKQPSDSFYVNILVALEDFFLSHHNRYKTVEPQIKQIFDDAEQEAREAVRNARRMIEEQMDRMGMTPSAREQYRRNNSERVIIEKALEPIVETTRKAGVECSVGSDGIFFPYGHEGAMYLHSLSLSTTKDCLHLQDYFGDRSINLHEHQCLLMVRQLLFQYKTSDETLEDYISTFKL